PGLLERLQNNGGSKRWLADRAWVDFAVSRQHQVEHDEIATGNVAFGRDESLVEIIAKSAPPMSVGLLFLAHPGDGQMANR
ncbi:MAG: hypothetical protein OEU92_14390, partial [Alphaproteobacteria bacterium]|nr:hypothetical protein [Alphaproteobacteria bacterium]